MKANTLKITNSYLDLLATTLKVNVLDDHQSPILQINNELACGQIKVFPSGKDKWYTEIDITTYADIRLPFLGNDTNLIHFIYCCKGNLFHSADAQETRIGEFQTAIVYDQNASEFLFKNREANKVAIISVAKPIDRTSPSIVNDIHTIFKEKLINGRFIYYGSSNLKIAEEVAKISQTNKKGIVKKLFVEGVIQLVLAMEIQHHQKDISSEQDLYGLLTLREQKIVKEIAKEIQSNYDYPFSIKYLMQKTGLSAAKLQEGFKLLYDRTVTDYIKNIRIEKAEDLLKTTDLNISEVVYSIGFTSRSYFSKIFKEKYNCSPRYYQEKSRIYSLPITA